jgi:hypothetical protein
MCIFLSVKKLVYYYLLLALHLLLGKACPSYHQGKLLIQETNRFWQFELMHTTFQVELYRFLMSFLSRIPKHLCLETDSREVIEMNEDLYRIQTARQYCKYGSVFGYDSEYVHSRFR